MMSTITTGQGVEMVTIGQGVVCVVVVATGIMTVLLPRVQRGEGVGVEVRKGIGMQGRKNILIHFMRIIVKVLSMLIRILMNN